MKPRTFVVDWTAAGSLEIPVVVRLMCDDPDMIQPLPGDQVVMVCEEKSFKRAIVGVFFFEDMPGMYYVNTIHWNDAMGRVQ